MRVSLKENTSPLTEGLGEPPRFSSDRGEVLVGESNPGAQVDSLGLPEQLQFTEVFFTNLGVSCSVAGLFRGGARDIY